MFICKDCFQVFKVGRITRCAHDGVKIRRVNLEVPHCDFYYSFIDVRAGFNGIERILSCYSHTVSVIFDYEKGVYLGRVN